MTVELPKSKHCWYTAVRVYLFTVDLTKFEAKIPANQRTIADHATWNPPLCTTGATGACWSGTAAAQYPVDAPAQLYEYTVISQDPATGAAFGDPNNPKGIPLADIDVSYVDELYLPVASNVDDGGATPYMGTTLPYDNFNKRTKAFLNLTAISGTQPIWSEYAAYTAANWPHNVFNNLGSPQTDHIVGKDIVGDVRIIPPNILPPLSALYDPPYMGPQQCNDVPAVFQPWWKLLPDKQWHDPRLLRQTVALPNLQHQEDDILGRLVTPPQPLSRLATLPWATLLWTTLRSTLLLPAGPIGSEATLAQTLPPSRPGPAALHSINNYSAACSNPR